MIAAVIDLAAERKRRRRLRCKHCGGEILPDAGVCERWCIHVFPEARRAWVRRAHQRFLEMCAATRGDK